MASSIFEFGHSLKVEDIFDDLYDTDPEATAYINEQEALKKEAAIKINGFLQALTKKIQQFRCGEISGSFLACEMFRLYCLVNDEVVS